MSDFIFDQAQRDWEEEPDDESDDKCGECGQGKCVCDQLDGWDEW